MDPFFTPVMQFSQRTGDVILSVQYVHSDKQEMVTPASTTVTQLLPSTCFQADECGHVVTPNRLIASY